MSMIDRMFDVAKRILAAGRKRLAQDMGVTIIVHPAQLGAEPGPVAIVTTLPSRAHERVVFAQALLGAALADGATAENVSEMVLKDLAAIAGDP